MKRLAFLVPIALCACNSQPSVTATNASTAEVAAKAAAMVRVEPGNWKTSVKMIDIQMPGIKDPRVAESMKEAMKSHGNAAREFNYCVTPEQAAKPNAEMFVGNDSGDCLYDRFSMADGKIASKMTCRRGGGTMTMTMNGTYSLTAYTMTADMVGIGPDGSGTEGSVNMKLETTAMRTGQCTTPNK